jgi:signal transduction histidine kinase
MNHSIRWRLVLSFVFVALVIVGLSGLMAIVGIGQYALAQEGQYLTFNAQAIATQAQQFMSPTIDKSQLRELAQTAAFFVNAEVHILDSKRQIVVDTGPSTPIHSDPVAWVVYPDDQKSSLPDEVKSNGWVIGVLPLASNAPVPISPKNKPITVVRRLRNTWGSHFTFETLNDQNSDGSSGSITSTNLRDNRIVTVPIGDAQSPSGYVELTAGVDFVSEAQRATWQSFFFAGIAAIILSGIAGVFMGNRLSTPVTQLMETTRKMSAGDLTVRANIQNQDEIGELANQFNNMAAQLELNMKKVENERDTLHRFITDASHELRTPITALRNFIDLLQGAAANDPAASAEFLAESKLQVDRLAWITQNLLVSSRLEGGLIPMEMLPDSVQDLVERMVIPFKLQAEEKNQTITVDLPEKNIEILCDQRYIETALSNLLDNAIKYTPRGGHIIVKAEETHGIVRISVQDDGPGIHPTDLPHIFQRFYRGRNNWAKGDGLGLSIVQSIAQAHGWRVKVENIVRGGSKFTLEI